jgi:hypothetical protein
VYELLPQLPSYAAQLKNETPKAEAKAATAVATAAGDNKSGGADDAASKFAALSLDDSAAAGKRPASASASVGAGAGASAAKPESKQETKAAVGGAAAAFARRADAMIPEMLRDLAVIMSKDADRQI